MNIKKIAVIGAGTMGNGIAHVFAQYGFQVKLIDVNSRQLDKAIETIKKNIDRQIKKGIVSEADKPEIIGRITTGNYIIGSIGDVDLVVEAATENEDIKLKIFREIDGSAPENAILASNTSSISITKIAACTRRPERVIGMHFMNPVPMMRLVEIINGYHTDKEVTNQIVQLSKAIGKTPCAVNDYPGFVANRILMPMINEAIYSLYEGVAGVEEIDTVMKLGMAHPMGPLQLADFIGLDVCLSITEVLYSGFQNQKYAACPLLKKMVAAGSLGKKSGEGFYVYKEGSKELVVSNRFIS